MVTEVCRDCKWSAWTTTISKCSQTCDGGTQQVTMTRKHEIEADLHGALCTGPSVKTTTQECNTVNCPVNCKWSEWSIGEYGACSVTCGIGKQYRKDTRNEVQKAMYGGNPCQGESERVETAACDAKMCPATACIKLQENGKKPALVKSYQSCFNFTQCDASYKPHLHRCPIGTAFHEEKCTSEGLSYCVKNGDNPEYVNCQRGRLYPDMEDCASFMKCDHQKFHKDKCQEGYFFDFKKQGCRTKLDVTCFGVDVIDKRSEKCVSGSMIKDNGNCSNYLLCVDGDFITRQCAAGTYFDETSSGCDARVNPCVDETTPKKDGKCVPEDNYMPTDDCKGFIQCAGGIKHVKQCPKGLYFHKQTKVCNYGNPCA